VEAITGRSRYLKSKDLNSIALVRECDHFSILWRSLMAGAFAVKSPQAIVISQRLETKRVGLGNLKLGRRVGGGIGSTIKNDRVFGGGTMPKGFVFENGELLQLTGGNFLNTL